MKSKTLPLSASPDQREDLKRRKLLLEKLGRASGNPNVKGKLSERLRIVQSTKAGHIRGGHAFH